MMASKEWFTNYFVLGLGCSGSIIRTIVRNCGKIKGLPESQGTKIFGNQLEILFHKHAKWQFEYDYDFGSFKFMSDTSSKLIMYSFRRDTYQVYYGERFHKGFGFKNTNDFLEHIMHFIKKHY